MTGTLFLYVRYSSLAMIAASFVACGGSGGGSSPSDLVGHSFRLTNFSCSVGAPTPAAAQKMNQNVVLAIGGSTFSFQTQIGNGCIANNVDNVSSQSGSQVALTDAGTQCQGSNCQNFCSNIGATNQTSTLNLSYSGNALMLNDTSHDGRYCSDPNGAVVSQWLQTQ